MKNQILSLVLFILTTSLMVVQGETTNQETTNETKIEQLISIAETDVRVEYLGGLNHI